MSAEKQTLKASKTKSNIKVITKARIVLAEPSKLKVPSLEKNDFEKLQELLVAAIKESNQIGRVYATSTKINIGLESTLRSINNCKAGCVLLSANIKPKYVLGLIARNSEVKDAQVPVYVQPELEDVTCNIFNIRALALTLPKESKFLNAGLQSWIQSHLRPKKTELSLLPVKPRSTKPKPKILQTKTPKATAENKTEVKSDLPQAKPWGNDYISFSADNAMNVDEDASSDDHDKLQDALQQMINKVQKPNIVLKPETTKQLPAIVKQEKSKTSNDNSDEDDFLGSYAPLTLQKICPNPNREPRKKRSKAKKFAK